MITQCRFRVKARRAGGLCLCREALTSLSSIARIAGGPWVDF